VITVRRRISAGPRRACHQSSKRRKWRGRTSSDTSCSATRQVNNP
jgi:hypothetical protein